LMFVPELPPTDRAAAQSTDDRVIASKLGFGATFSRIASSLS